MTPDMMHDAGPDVSRFGNKGFHPAPIAGRKARSGTIIVRRTSKIGRHPVKQRFFTIFAADNPTAMNFKKISLLILILLIADQLLKIWVKTHMHLDESIVVFPDWFQLRFIENNGAAFGMHIATKGGFDWGKLLLGIFRIVMVGVIGWLMHHLINKRKDTPKGVIVGLALVMAGALGNIIDSAFYGLLFSESTPYTVAHFGGHYAGFMMGKVVDMFYFPLFQWNGVPRFLNFLVDSNNYFFGAIFNLADAYISIAVIYLLLFQYKFLSK